MGPTPAAAPIPLTAEASLLMAAVTSVAALQEHGSVTRFLRARTPGQDTRELPMASRSNRLPGHPWTLTLRPWLVSVFEENDVCLVKGLIKGVVIQSDAPTCCDLLVGAEHAFMLIYQRESIIMKLSRWCV